MYICIKVFFVFFAPSLVIKLEQMKFSKKFFKCLLHQGEIPNLLYVCLPNDDFKQKAEAAQEEEEEEEPRQAAMPAACLSLPLPRASSLSQLNLKSREFKYRFISYILPSSLGSYALVSLSKRSRGTPLLPHNNNNNDNAYEQKRCSRTRLRAATRTHAPPQQVHAYKQCVAWHVFFICFFCSFFFFFYFYSAKC